MAAIQARRSAASRPSNNVEDLAGGDVDHRGDEAAPPTPMRRSYHGLVEADHLDGTHPGWVVHPDCTDSFDRGPHR